MVRKWINFQWIRNAFCGYTRLKSTISDQRWLNYRLFREHLVSTAFDLQHRTKGLNGEYNAHSNLGISMMIILSLSSLNRIHSNTCLDKFDNGRYLLCSICRRWGSKMAFILMHFSSLDVKIIYNIKQKCGWHRWRKRNNFCRCLLNTRKCLTIVSIDNSIKYLNLIVAACPFSTTKMVYHLHLLKQFIVILEADTVHSIA